MAVAVQMDFRGATVEQYDQVLKLMGLTPQGPGPAGCLSHFAAATADGIRIVDVWRTQEEFERFAAEQIGPYSQQAGITAPPTTQFLPVHNYFTPNA